MRKGFRIIKFKKDKPVFQIKDVSKTLDEIRSKTSSTSEASAVVSNYLGL